MGLLTAPLTAALQGARAARAGMRAATYPARAAGKVTLGTYEELLDVAERAEVVEPPDPSAKALARREKRRRRPAA